MPESDRLSMLFGGLASAELPVPPEAGVVSRGRQRRRRQRIIASVSTLAVIAAAGSTLAYVRAAAGGHVTGASATLSTPGGRSAAGPGAQPSVAGPVPGSVRASDSARQPPGSAATLPPPGHGLLVLGLNASGEFAMGRMGSAYSVPVTSLRPVVADQSLIGTDPAGGWVVTEGVGRPARFNTQAERLATVSKQGLIRPFGPVFGPQRPVASLAVRPDGRAVAVSVTHVTASGCLCSAAQIELIPMPGRPGRIRIWTLASPRMTLAEDLSWAPGGTRLTYIPGSDATGGGFAGIGAVTLNTAAAGMTAGVVSRWTASTSSTRCMVDAGSWAGKHYIALETCSPAGTILVPASASTGPVPGVLGLRVPGPGGCGDSSLDPISRGGQILISYCGVFVDSRDRLSSLPGPLSKAAWAGAQ